jgi:hypothetical protein
MGIETFFGNMFGISDTAGNSRRDAASLAQIKANEVADSVPSAASIAGSATTAAEKARIRKKTKTILTSPLTGGEDYGSAAPTLLGSGDKTKKTTLG